MGCLFVGEKLHGPLAEKIIGPDIIKTGNMVFV